MNIYDPIDSYLETNLEKSIAELSRLCAQPSISAQNLGLSECAHLVAEMLQERGFNFQIMISLDGFKELIHQVLFWLVQKLKLYLFDIFFFYQLDNWILLKILSIF